MERMTHASLFSGIGGAELAASWMGWENIFHCEINPFARKVLEYHFPNSISYENIKTTDFTPHRGDIDIITGGFPCQPFSLAGRRKGADDDRYLWDEMLRAICEIQPTWVVAENVYGIASMVQPGEEVAVGCKASLFEENNIFRKEQLYTIEQICQDFEDAGYTVQPVVIPACAVGAPHRRDRVWFIAYRADAGIESLQREGANRIRTDIFTPNTGCDGGQAQAQRQRSENTEDNDQSQSFQHCGDASHSNHAGFQATRTEQQATGTTRNLQNTTHTQSAREPRQCLGKSWEEESNRRDCQTVQARWRDFPTQPPIRRRYDGISNSVVRYINNKVYETIKEYYRDEDLPGLWQYFQQEEIREKIGRLYEIQEPDILLQVLQCSTASSFAEQGENVLSSFSKEVSERVLRYMRKHGKFGCSPLGQKYQKQFKEQLADTLPFLSHEIASATKKIVEECASQGQKVREESIKAYGNAWVPQVAYEIFKIIEQYGKEI